MKLPNEAGKITALLNTTRPGAIRLAHTGSYDPGRPKSQMRQTMAESKHTGNPGNFAEDREKAARAGHVGGQHSSGNFAHDRERAAEAGRKGGQASHGSSHTSHGNSVGGEASRSRGGGAEHS